jgi:hypothetical protein
MHIAPLPGRPAASFNRMTMTRHDLNKARVGDSVDAHGVPGQPSRRGEIIELLGEAGHEHYRVRWDERHESILYPSDGVVIHAAGGAGTPAA